MAEFLIKAVDASHPDPTKDACGCYKRGDVVVVMEDGWAWGKEEGLPIFCLLKIEGLSVPAGRKYIESEIEIYSDALGDPLVRISRRRQYHVCMDELPADVLSALDTDGIAESNWGAVCSCVEDKVTGARVTA